MKTGMARRKGHSDMEVQKKKKKSGSTFSPKHPSSHPISFLPIIDGYNNNKPSPQSPFLWDGWFMALLYQHYMNPMKSSEYPMSIP